MTRHLIMLSGILGSGKTKAIDESKIRDKNVLVVSPNKSIKKRAKQEGRSFIDLYSENIQLYTNITLDKIINSSAEIIIWNQENLTVESRKLKMGSLSNFKFYSIHFKPPEYKEANNNYQDLYGEIYNQNKYELFKRIYQKPDYFEGFETIEDYNNNIKKKINNI